MQKEQPLPKPQFKQELHVDFIIRLIKDTTREFKNQTYDVNHVARNCIEGMVCKDRQQMGQQVLAFVQLLSGAPRYFVQLLNEEAISSQTHIITLNSRNWDIVQRIFKDFALLTNTPPSPSTHDSPDLHSCILRFINTVAKAIAGLYQKLAENITSKMQKLIKTVKKSKMMNNFLLFKIFRELSEEIKSETIDICIDSVFRYCQLQIIEEFYRYTINKYEVVKLFAGTDVEDSLFEPCPLKKIASLQKNPKIDILMKEAVNEDGKYAIFVNPQSAKQEIQKTLDDYLLFIDTDQSLRMINCKTVRKHWYIIGQLKNNFKLEKMAREYMKEGQFMIDSKRKDNNLIVPLLFDCIPLQNFTNLDGVIGRCLFLMKKYLQASQFFQDLSKRAILSKSIEQIMHTLPIVGFMLAAGSITKAFFRIFSNRFSTDIKKLSELTGFVVKAGATIGSSMVGAFIGQALIPVPIVGALVGTVVGGIVGERGCRQVSSMICSSQFQIVIVFLKQNIKNNCYWKASQQFYDLIGVKKKQFQNYIPSHMPKDVFVTVVGFVLVCFHQSTRLAKHNQKRQKSEEEEQQRKGRDRKEPESNYQRQKQFEESVRKLSQYSGFQTQFNMNCIIQYLQKHNAGIYEHYEVLQKSILTFLTKILPK